MVLAGTADGQPVRWSFVQIRPESFTWRGESRQDDGQWKLESEFQLRRIA